MYSGTDFGGAKRTSVASVASVDRHDEPNDPSPFPLTALPPVMRREVEAVSAVTSASPVLPCGCALATVAASVGKGLVVRSGDDRVTRANLYIGLFAESGDCKSETYRHVLKPLLDLEVRSRAYAAQRKYEYAAVQDVAAEKIRKLRREAAASDDPNMHEDLAARIAQCRQALDAAAIGLRPTRLICEDCTSPELSRLLADHNETLFSASPDAGAAIAELTRTQSADTPYVKGYSGEPTHVDRTTRRHVPLISPCLSLLWLMQPDRITELFGRRRLDQGGFLPRVMMAQAPEAGAIDPGARIDPQIKFAWHDLVTSLVKCYHDAKGPPAVLEIDPDITAFLTDEQNRIAELRRGELSDIGRYLARWVEWGWRLTVVLHAASWGADADRQTVAIETAQDAMRLARWFADRQLEFLLVSREAQKEECEAKVFRLLEHRAEITARDLQMRRIVHSSSQATTLLESMVAERKLRKRTQPPDHGGHTATYYTRAAP